MKTLSLTLLGAAFVLAGGAAWSDDGQYTEAQLKTLYDRAGRYNTDVVFPSLVSGDPIAGRAAFGVAADDLTIDTSQALFEGQSVIYGKVVSNGTACATCHQPANHFLLPPLPISQHVAANDPLRTGRDAEAQGDPRQAPLFDQLGLLKIRPNRFNPLLPESSPFRRYFGWRKTQTIINMAFAYGLLTDLRARGAVEQARGAAFNHTQLLDVRFDDLVNPRLPAIAAYMQTEIRPAALKDLLDPTAPNYAALVADPFSTVPVQSALQAEGREVFRRDCMGCHDLPNVFSNREHVDGNGPNFPPVAGHAMDIGVAQRNRHGLDFRAYDPATGAYETLVLPLAREDGALVEHAVTDDVGAAAATGRYEDLHCFKVPQLRELAKLAPYFHDNSAATLEEVVDFFNSADYNRSGDGRRHPIHESRDERRALLAFLNIL